MTAAAPLNDSYANSLTQIAAAYSYQLQGFPLDSTTLANTGTVHLNQSGFIGGGQIGYNFRIGTNFIVGMETDIQGVTISSRGSYISGAAGNASFTNPGAYQGTETRSALGAGSVSSGVDWMGTVRSRLGYLITPELLAYGTGGLAYGGVRASATHTWVHLTDIKLDTRSLELAPSCHGVVTLL